VSRARVTRVTKAGAGHRVLTVEGGRDLHRSEPCADCPWRVDARGKFPPEAFRASAHVAHDMARSRFGCHASGKDRPATCAGFLLRAGHNLSVRLMAATGRIDLSRVSEGGHALWGSYREMAEANGVDPGDPALEKCR
jgi:hypothetical protein